MKQLLIAGEWFYRVESEAEFETMLEKFDHIDAHDVPATFPSLVTIRRGEIGIQQTFCYSREDAQAFVNALQG